MVKSKLLIFIILLCFSIVILVVASTSSSAQYYLTIDELREQNQQYRDKIIRVSGKVLESSINYDADSQQLFFILTSMENGDKKEHLHNRNVLKVRYQGDKPDLLNNNTMVIVSGKMINDNEIVADELLFKCPSKYEGN